ncbi:hypothetical protein O5275_15065 [Escherichia coli]|nr:hypothetical protein [Escherichia coli]
MNTLSAAYQFTADAFRHFIIRTLTDDIPPDGVEKEIARFILRHPAFNGGWLLFLAAEIHERSRTHNSITVTVSVDNYLSWMDIAVSGLPELPDMPFCDFFHSPPAVYLSGCAPDKIRRRMMKIHRISPETLITLIHAHLAGKTDSTAKEEHRLLRRFLRDDDGRLVGVLLNIAGILQFNRELSARHNYPATPLSEFSLRKRGKQLHLCLCSLRFFYIPPVFIRNEKRKCIVVHINKITYPPVNSLR